MTAHVHAKFISCSRVVICEFDVENGLRVVEHLLDSLESDCLLEIGLHDLYDDLNLALRPDHWGRQLKPEFRPQFSERQPDVWAINQMHVSDREICFMKERSL